MGIANDSWGNPMTSQLTHLRAQQPLKDLQRKADAAPVGRRRWGAASSVKPGPAHRAYQREDGVTGMLDVRAFRAGSVLGFGALRSAAATGRGANRMGMRAVVGRPVGRMSSFGPRRTIGVLSARVVGVLVATTGLMGLSAVALAGSAAAALPSSCMHSGDTVTCSYTNSGRESTFTVPAGVSTISVTAIGAPGRNSFDNGGGRAALVSNTALPVTRGPGCRSMSAALRTSAVGTEAYLPAVSVLAVARISALEGAAALRRC